MRAGELHSTSTPAVMKFLIGITVLAVLSCALAGELDFEGDLGHLEFDHGDVGGHGELGGHELHGVATSYQNVHLESHNPVPVIVHHDEEHHHHHDLGGGFEGLSVEEHGHDHHDLGGYELH